MGKLFNLLFYFVFAVNLICLTNSEATNQRFCADPNCQKIISTGLTKRDYNSDTKGKISFRAREHVEVYSKPTDPKDALWEIKIGGRKGLAPSEFVQEQKIITKQNELVRVPYPPTKPSVKEALKSSIPTKNEEISTTPPLPNEPALVISQQNNEDSINASEISSHPAKSTVVDGTTIHSDFMPGEDEEDEEEDEDGDDDAVIGEEEDDSEGANRTTLEGLESDKISKLREYKKVATEKTQPLQDKSNEKNEKTATDSNNKNPELSPPSGNKEKGLPAEKAALTNQGTVDDAVKQINITVSPPEQKDSIEKEINTSPVENSSHENNEKSSEVPSSHSDLKAEQPAKFPASDLEKDQTILSENITNEKIASGNLLEQSTAQENADKVQKQQEQTKTTEPISSSSDTTEPQNKNKEEKEIDTQNNKFEGVSSEINNNITKKEKPGQETVLFEQRQTYENVEPVEKKTEPDQSETLVEAEKPAQEIRNSRELVQERAQQKVGGNNQAPLSEGKPLEATPSPEINTVNKFKPAYQPKPPLLFNNRAQLQPQDSSQQTPTTEAPKQPPITEVPRQLPITEVPKIETIIPTEDQVQISTTTLTTEAPKQPPITEALRTLPTPEISKTETKLPTEDQVQISTTEAPKIEQQVLKEEQKHFGTESPENVDKETETTETPNDKKLTQSVSEATQIPESVTLPVETPQVEEPSKIYPPFYSPVPEVVSEAEQHTFTESPIEAVAQTITENPAEAIAETITENPLEAQQHFEEATTETFTETPLKTEQYNEEVTTESTASIADEDIIQQSPNHVKIYPEQVKTDWFFSNVLDTVYNFWSTQSKEEESMSEDELSAELRKILYPEKTEQTKEVSSVPDPSEGFCEKLTPDSCPSDLKKPLPSTHLQARERPEICSSEKDFFSSLSDKVLEMVDLLACLLIAAFTTLLFAFGYYCICHSRKEGVLISKLNIVERSLLVTTKESAILKHDLIETRNKLTSIEDNSFGSNDMVIALKRDLQDSEETRIRLQEQVTSLEKELENAAEAGLELNKIVSELLNNQSGDESIISSVEELQKQLNEQQNTIIQINTTLAEKSRENSELQLIIANQGARFDEEVKELKQEKEDLQKDKAQVEVELEELRQKMEEQLAKAEEDKRAAITAIGKDMSALKEKYNEMQRKLQTSEARVQVLEECLNGVKNSTKFNIKELLDAVNLKTDLLATRRERDSLKERLEGEIDARKLLEDHVSIISEEVSRLKQEHNQSEKEKVEAKTRLEVLSSYFKEKETQLQKELSLKDALWLKQQGETSSTVERVQHMQDEIQFLKSQNDSLRAEIEAQAATHKAQIANLENRAHETWLAARQSERKMEEARTEATALRRKLTSLAGNPAANDVNSQNRVSNNTEGIQNDVNNVPSPVHMESPGSPLLGGLPPPLPFLPPPPFMGPPHPFMPMPPPFMPPGEMRPPPLGRLMSPPPPPPPDRYSPSLVDERNRYTPENGRYSPDSRYNYTTDIMSNYDTETDFSPPPSPGGRPGGGNTGGGYNSRDRDRDRDRDRERSRAYKPYSPPPPNSTDRNKKSKGILSSGSADSYDSRKSKGKRKV